jgi:metal-responsive CopG/Arc/MetJ family transcriptional regulator
MILMKIAISVPDEIFQAGERLAGQLGMSRSRLYAEALSAYLGARGAAAVTAQLNAVYSKETAALDPALAHAQLKHLPDEAW